MKISVLLVTFLFCFMNSFACPVSPSYQIAMDPNKYAEKYNAVFFGRLCGIDYLNDDTQIAEFQVMDIFKGNLKVTVRIVNKIKTDCSRAFKHIATNYYVFGNLENGDEEIVMNGFPGFVTEDYAKEMGILNELPTVISKKRDAMNKFTCLMSAVDD